MNDDERELKAMLNKPGKYNVIYNQDSFKAPPDTDNEDYLSEIKFESGLDDDMPWGSTFFEVDNLMDNDDDSSDDSEIFIVPRFEDPTSRRVSSTSISNSRGKNSLSSTPSGDSYSSCSDETSTHDMISSWDSKYLAQYQKYISLHLRQINVFTGLWANPYPLSDSPDIFEMESRNFPPVCVLQF